jgi:hypothetical protein
MTVGQSIDYDGLTQQALRTVVHAVLSSVAKTGLPGEHHFFIAFDTRAPGVGMSRRLKEKYPEEMMVVLQHRFWDLSVSDDRFEVKLTFDGIPERLLVPFAAIKLFFDPSVRFTLQFEEPSAADAAPAATERRRPLEVSEASTDNVRPARRTTERRPRSKPTSGDRPAEASQEAAPDASTPVADAPRDTAVTTGESSDHQAPPPALPAVISPAPSPAGAKVVSIDSWRNRK